MLTDNLRKNIDFLSKTLSCFDSSFPEYIDNISQLKRDFETELARIDADGQRLSIGIMGQVKAGKSSFLNALLFDGQPILPEAATPKTANLTRISYGVRPLFAVHYYSKEEWADFTKETSSGSESPRALVARGLLEMAHNNEIDVQAIIARKKEEFSANSVGELMGKLNDFVGENGKYTGLVKFTEVQLPLDDLQGFEIIDTPGMNDPVPSRTQKTRDYMAECDVVFFLSRCSQFLDQSDMSLLAQQLPSKGVKRMVLVAGQLDGVIADDGYDRSSLAETEKNVRSRISRRAEKEIESLADTREKLGNPKIAELIRSLKYPIFSSTFAHGFARWDEKRWGKSMQHAHSLLTEMADTQWNGYKFTKKDWERLGNFPALEKAYQQARQDKELLLQARRDDLLPRNQKQLDTYLSELRLAAEQRIAQLKTGDIQTIETSATACRAKISGISGRLAKNFDAAIARVRGYVSDVKSDLQGEIASAGKVQTRTGQRKETSSYTKSTSSWYKPWTWGDRETIYETNYVEYEYIAVSDVIDRLANYADESGANLCRSFNDIVSMSALRADLKRDLIEELTHGGEGFDPSAFRSVLESTLSHLRLPDLEIDLGDSGQLISSQFSGKAKSEKKMEALRERLREALNIVFQQLVGAADEATERLVANLEKTRDALEEKLTVSIQGELDQLKKAFANKKSEIKRYETLVQICKGNPATPIS